MYLIIILDQFLLRLQEGDPAMIKKVIKEMYDQMQDGSEVYKYSIKNPILLSAVFTFLGDPDSEIRELSSLCFIQFCKILITKKMLENLSYIDKFLNHDFKLINQQAKITKDIIIWKP